MWHHLTSKAKGKRKRGESSSSSSQAQSDTPTSLFAVIVSFPFIFIYTCSFEFIVMFYFIYVFFIYRAQQPLGSDMSKFLGCYTVRSSSQLQRSRWPERRRLTWRSSPLRSTRHARRLPRSRTSHRLRTMVRRRVHRRGEASSRSSSSTTG
jgi:hypothetical protein